jgi:hypothetical protein
MSKTGHRQNAFCRRPTIATKPLMTVMRGMDLKGSGSLTSTPVIRSTSSLK